MKRNQKIWWKITSDPGSRKCKGPEAGMMWAVRGIVRKSVWLESRKEGERHYKLLEGRSFRNT